MRINVHVGAMVTDQGLLEGRARETLLYRRQLGSEIAIAADVLVKHAAPLGPTELSTIAHDTVARGLADALIVTGSGTGRPTSPRDLKEVAAAVPETPLWVGSGLQPDAVPEIHHLVQGAIVGTELHRDRDLGAPLDIERVRRMVAALRGG